MLSESQQIPDWIASSEQIGLLAAQALRPRAPASVPSLNAMRYLRESRSQPTDRRESAFLESACAHPG